MSRSGGDTSSHPCWNRPRPSSGPKPRSPPRQDRCSPCLGSLITTPSPMGLTALVWGPHGASGLERGPPLHREGPPTGAQRDLAGQGAVPLSQPPAQTPNWSPAGLGSGRSDPHAFSVIITARRVPCVLLGDPEHSPACSSPSPPSRAAPSPCTPAPPPALASGTPALGSGPGASPGQREAGLRSPQGGTGCPPGVCLSPGGPPSSHSCPRGRPS